MKANKYHLMAGISLSGLLVWGYFHLRNRKRDELASKLLRKITRLIDPSSKGLLAESAFDVNYVDRALKKESGSVILLHPNTARKYAKWIRDSFGDWFWENDDEAKVYGVLRKLKDKAQVSQVAKAYFEQFDKNLIDGLQSHFNDEEVQTVLQIVGKLPPYRIKK